MPPWPPQYVPAGPADIRGPPTCEVRGAGRRRRGQRAAWRRQRAVVEDRLGSTLPVGLQGCVGEQAGSRQRAQCDAGGRDRAGHTATVAGGHAGSRQERSAWVMQGAETWPKQGYNHSNGGAPLSSRQASESTHAHTGTARRSKH